MKTKINVVLVVIALILSVLLVSPSSATSHWTLVGTHPDAAAQPTARGKTLHELHYFAWSNSVYVGYGDYGANTGPIKHTPWNVGDKAFQFEAYQDTEEVNNYQEFSGILWSPSVDPACCGSPLELPANASDYANINGLRQWPDSDKFSSVHVFDIRKVGEAMIASGSDFGCGSSCGVVWRSDNGGASWVKWYQTTRTAPNTTTGDRCYALAVHNNRVWADCTAGDVTFNGSSWVADSSQQYAHKETLLFGNTLVSLARGNLYSWDGSTERLLRSGSHRFVAVDGSDLYVVNGFSEVFRTTDLVNWTKVATLGSNNSSFTAAKGVLYYGDTSSRLFQMTVGSTTPTTSSSTTTTVCGA